MSGDNNFVQALQAVPASGMKFSHINKREIVYRAVSLSNMFLSFEWNHCITESLNSCVKERRVAFALGSATSAIVTRSLGRKQESSVFEISRFRSKQVW